MHWDWDGKGKCKSKFPSIMGFGLKSMTVGKGNRSEAILYTCQNQMGKGREWDCLFILGWEMVSELNFQWEREGIGN